MEEGKREVGKDGWMEEGRLGGGRMEEGKDGRLGGWRVLALHFLLLTGLKFYIYEEDGYG